MSENELLSLSMVQRWPGNVSPWPAPSPSGPVAQHILGDAHVAVRDTGPVPIYRLTAVLPCTLLQVHGLMASASLSLIIDRSQQSCCLFANRNP